MMRNRKLNNTKAVRDSAHKVVKNELRLDSRSFLLDIYYKLLVLNWIVLNLSMLYYLVKREFSESVLLELHILSSCFRILLQN